ncbi:MAG: sulfotransferase domain-containing protein [Rhodovibrionaceae bacterium]
MGAIIWLASFPKSGNTWMRALLHNLLRNPERPTPINEIDKFSLGEATANWYYQYTEKKASELTLEELAELRPKVHKSMMGAHPDSVFVKTHSYLGESCGRHIHTMECTAGAIYVVRNPLDVCPSFANHFGLSIDDAIAAMEDEKGLGAATDKNVAEIITSWSLNVRSWTQVPHPQIKAVRYEDLLERPVNTFGGVARFLGLDPPKDRLKKAIKFSSFKELSRQEATAGFKERSDHAKKFFNVGKRDQWREKLTEAQISRIVEKHREQMERFKYVPAGY